MKKALVSLLVLATTQVFAATTIHGTWKLSSRECSSNAPVNDGLKIEQDSVEITYAPDMSFLFKSQIGSCKSWSTGTYALDGMKLTNVIKQSQSCTDLTPAAMDITRNYFVAFADEKNAIIVTTGPNAEKVCPVSDALISRYMKQ